MCTCELAHALFLRSTELCLEEDVGMRASLDFVRMKQSHSNRGKKQKGNTCCCRPVWRQISTAALVFEGLNFGFLGYLLGDWYPAGGVCVCYWME